MPKTCGGTILSFGVKLLHQLLIFRDCTETNWTETGLPGAEAVIMNPSGLQETQAPIFVPDI